MLRIFAILVLISALVGCRTPSELELVTNSEVYARDFLASIPESETETREQFQDYLTYLRMRRRLLNGENLVETSYTFTAGYLFTGYRAPEGAEDLERGIGSPSH